MTGSSAPAARRRPAKRSRTPLLAASIIDTASGEPEGDDHAVGQAAQIVAYTPDDVAHVVYPFGVKREDWVADLPALLDTWGEPAEGVTVEGAWTAPTDDVAAAYLAIDNPGATERLVAASSDAAGSVWLMGRPTTPPWPTRPPATPASTGRCPQARRATRRAPRHFMLDDLRRPLEPGDTVRLQPTFERAGTITVDVEVVAWDDALDRIEADPAANHA
jgi:copper(I)-binding protein